MDFAKALTYPFDDEDWLKKLGIAAGIGLVTFFLLPFFIGLVGLIPLQGWAINTIKRVRANDPRPLAGWDDFGELFSTGLTPFLAGLVYFIPVLIVYCMAIPVFILPAMGGDNSDAVAALGSMAMLVFGCCMCLIVIYMLAANVVLWGGLIRYLDKPEFGTFMEFGENIAIVRENIQDFGMALLFIWIGGLIASVVGNIPCIGWLIIFPFNYYYSSHILGQLAQKVLKPAGSAPAV
jgi:hypothetical protein